jgi:hypothetical protein
MPHQSSQPDDVICRLRKGYSEALRGVIQRRRFRLSFSGAWTALISFAKMRCRRDIDRAVARPACHNISIEAHRILSRLKYEEQN